MNEVETIGKMYEEAAKEIDMRDIGSHEVDVKVNTLGQIQEIAHKAQSFEAEQKRKEEELELKRQEAKTSRLQAWGTIGVGVIGTVFGAWQFITKLNTYKELDEKHTYADLEGELPSSPTREHNRVFGNFITK